MSKENLKSNYQTHSSVAKKKLLKPPKIKFSKTANGQRY